MFTHIAGKHFRSFAVSKKRRLEAAVQEYLAAELCLRDGYLGQAEDHYRNAIRSDPDAFSLHYNLGLLLHAVGDIAGAEACYRRALELEPNAVEVHSSFLGLCDFATHISPEESFQRHRRWAESHADPLMIAVAPHHNIPDPQRRLRIGYVSADLREHVIGRFIEPILTSHDQGRFDVHCYSSSGREDPTGRQLRALVPNWRDVQGMDDEHVAGLIRRDGIDLLIDLSGHSAGSRLLVFARKPAPLQLTWMGYLNTTGMQAMDYKVTDAIADPDGSERWYREKLLRLSRPQWCYKYRTDQISASDSAQARPSGRVRIGCMARFMKISDECIELWIELLGTLENACLRLIDVPNHPRAEDMRKRLYAAGLSDRIEFLPTLRGEAYWRGFNDLDIALDPFPYTGATTTMDCLWMGVPVVTIAGSHGAGRSAASVLSGVGLTHLIAGSRREYISIVLELARDVGAFAERKADVRARMRKSVICDAAGFTAEWEDRLRTVWSEWCTRADNIAPTRGNAA
jgi:protein O-GlcNAc transferase